MTILVRGEGPQARVLRLTSCHHCQELISEEVPYSVFRTDFYVMRAICEKILPERPRSFVSPSSQHAEAQLCDNLWEVCKSCWQSPVNRPNAGELTALFQP
jgi:hypothetical protein